MGSGCWNNILLFPHLMGTTVLRCQTIHLGESADPVILSTDTAPLPTGPHRAQFWHTLVAFSYLLFLGDHFPLVTASTLNALHPLVHARSGFEDHAVFTGFCAGALGARAHSAPPAEYVHQSASITETKHARVIDMVRARIITPPQ